MRFTRGKSTHQRVEGDATSWSQLKSTPAKSKNRNKHVSGSNHFSKGSNTTRRNGHGFKMEQRNEMGDEMSSNFTPLGVRPKGPGEDATVKGDTQEKNTKGFGKSKLVKIFGQFWVPPEDGKRLQDLQKKLQAEGLSRKEILDALQNERRRAEKAGKRRRDKTCFNCRQFGHVLSDCHTMSTSDKKGDANLISDGMGEICFKCGSTEHTSRRCKKVGEKFSFAKCFICSKSGHIARQCPDNSKGIYPSGGSCGDCGSVSHLRKDCPTANGNGVTNEDLNAVTSRVSDPLTATEYEPEDVSVQLTQKKISIVQQLQGDQAATLQAPVPGNQKTKKRKIKF